MRDRYGAQPMAKEFGTLQAVCPLGRTPGPDGHDPSAGHLAYRPECAIHLGGGIPRRVRPLPCEGRCRCLSAGDELNEHGAPPILLRRATRKGGAKGEHIPRIFHGSKRPFRVPFSQFVLGALLDSKKCGRSTKITKRVGALNDDSGYRLTRALSGGARSSDGKETFQDRVSLRRHFALETGSGRLRTPDVRPNERTMNCVHNILSISASRYTVGLLAI